jgi:hypothetical protein
MSSLLWGTSIQFVGVKGLIHVELLLRKTDPLFDLH